MENTQWQRRYVPKTDHAEWASRVTRIGELYAELLPVIKNIQTHHPECVRLTTTDIDASDGFMRLIDLVPNVQGVMMTLADDSYPASPRMRSDSTTSLCNKYAPKTDAIFNDVNAMLKQYLVGDDQWETRREARRIADDLEWALREAYQAAETMRGSSRMKG